MSLHGAYDTNNIFAKILRGDIPSVKPCGRTTTSWPSWTCFPSRKATS